MQLRRAPHSVWKEREPFRRAPTAFERSASLSGERPRRSKGARAFQASATAFEGARAFQASATAFEGARALQASATQKESDESDSRARVRRACGPEARRRT